MNTMNHHYQSPAVARRRVFLEKSMADTMVSVGIVAGTGAITQEEWPAVDITPSTTSDGEIVLLF
jgi:hypothetical protein